MENELQQADKLRRKKKRHHTFKRLGILLLLVLAVAAVVFFRQDIARLDIGVRLADLFASYTPGGDYPQDIPIGVVKDMLPIGGDIILLGDTNLYIYNAQGKQITAQKHGYQAPLCKVRGDRILTFDRGGKRLRIDTRSRNLAQYESGARILCADISPGGIWAVGQTSTTYKYQVQVFDRENEAIFIYHSAGGEVLDIAMQADGAGMVVASISAQEGEIYSETTYFRFDQTSAVASIILPDALLLSMIINDAGQVQLITDSGVYLYDDTGVLLAGYDYNGRYISSFANGTDGNVLLALAQLSDGSGITLVSLTDSLAVITEQPFQHSVLEMDYTQGILSVFTPDGIAEYNALLQGGQLVALPGAYDIQRAGAYLYGITSEKIIRVKGITE